MEMKTYEQLKSMTTEDLVRYAQEMQEKATEAEKSSEFWSATYMALKDRHDALRDSIKSLLKLTEDAKPIS